MSCPAPPGPGRRQFVASSSTHFHVADPAEVTETIVFLTSEGAGLVTGNTITLR